jgi:hypothetical protein
VRRLWSITLALLFVVMLVIPAEVVVAAPKDTSPPTTPSSLRAVMVSAGRVDLGWLASRDNVGVANYDVIRERYRLTIATTNQHPDTLVAPGTVYRYRVRARDGAGNVSGYSNLITVTTPSAVTFGAAGDHGAGSPAEGSLAALNASGVNFYLALGDLDYNETATPAAWCSFVKSRLPKLGANFPFQLVSGNHENTVIQQHAACLPDRLGSTLGPNSPYAAEYFFDYPKTAPLVRVLMISPNLTIANRKYTYSAKSPEYGWVSSVIDAGRRAGVPWTVVGMHKNCFSAGGHSCAIHADLMNLLIRKKADLVLQGHAHTYQRSKQLALNPSTCPVVPIGSYEARCVVDDGADGRYTRGLGTLTLIIGVFGKNGAPPDSTDPDAAYFAKMSGEAGGFVQFTVSRARIDAKFVRGRGTFTDSFSIS